MRDLIVIRISTRAAVAVVLAFAVFWLVAEFLNVLVVLFLAVLLAVSIAPLATHIHHLGIPRGAAILLVYLVVITIFAGATALLVPLIVNEVTQLAHTLPTYAERVRGLNLPVPIPESFPGSEITSRASSVLLRASTVALRTGEVFLTAVITVVISYFLVADVGFTERVIRRFVPAPHQERVLAIARVIAVRLGEWLRAQVVVAFLFGVAMTTGMLVMGLPYAITIGVVGALVEVIPYVGGLVTISLASLVALAVNPWLIPVVIVWYLIVTTLEAHVLVPTVMGRMIGLQPVLVIVALFIGGKVYGLLGALLAVPVVVVIQVLLDELYANQPSPQPEVSQPPRRARRIAATILRDAVTHGRAQRTREPT